jgi:predicted GIY-YIG superfamily endonuclease
MGLPESEPIMQGAYLLHCETKLAERASHYTGWSSDIEQRIAAHFRGNSAKIVEAYSRNDIRFVVARVWLGTPRGKEHELKRAHNGPRHCPICRGEVHPGFAIDIKQLLFQKGPPALASYVGRRRPMNTIAPDYLKGIIHYEHETAI